LSTFDGDTFSDSIEDSVADYDAVLPFFRSLICIEKPDSAAKTVCIGGKPLKENRVALVFDII
jgi:hypothetical protein